MLNGKIKDYLYYIILSSKLDQQVGLLCYLCSIGLQVMHSVQIFSDHGAQNTGCIVKQCSSDSAISARSSAYSNSHCKPSLNSFDNASNTMTNNSGLSTMVTENITRNFNIFND